MNYTRKQGVHNNKRTQGTLSEEKAKQYIQAKKYEILHMNYRCKIGEIDIIAKDGAYIVFIEVKSRSSCRLGYPREAVNWKKQQTIIKVAQWYLVSRGSIYIPCRFDVIELLGSEIQHIQNAFGVQ